MEDENNKILRFILGLESDACRKSTLQLALKQARRLGGVTLGESSSHTQFILRRSKEGQDKDEMADAFFDAYSEEEMDVLTSLSLYLIVLDQLGHIFGKHNNKSNRVRDAIDLSFTTAGMSDAELDAIKELRNSINHNFGLSSCRPGSEKGEFKFIICFDDNGNNKPVVEPHLEWNGDWFDKSEDTSFHVYPFSLMNYVEKIIESFASLIQKGKITSTLSMEELKTRFTINICSNRHDVQEFSTEVTKEDLANAWTDEFGAKYSKDKKRLLLVPSIIQNYVIKEGTRVICNGAFSDDPMSGNNHLLSVFIPKTVTHIGDGAFKTCFSLESINIPNSVVYIGKAAFSHCYKINAPIPNSVTYIGDAAYCNCRSLAIFEIPKSVSYIGSAAFANCYSLTQINILGDVKTIKDNTFADCSWLTKVLLPSTISHIEERAFFKCYRLEEINLPDSIQTIDDYAFEDCRTLTHIELPHQIMHFGKKVFQGCESLQTIVVPQNFIKINDYAFYNCGVSDINLSNSTSHIGVSAFEECAFLYNIIIPESVIYIGSSAFRCTSLRNVTIPKSVVSIGNNAFDDCIDLSSVTFTSSDIVIGVNAFGHWCNRIIIPNGTRDKFEKLLPDYKDKLIEQMDYRN